MTADVEPHPHTSRAEAVRLATRDADHQDGRRLQVVGRHPEMDPSTGWTWSDAEHHERMDGYVDLAPVDHSGEMTPS